MALAMISLPLSAQEERKESDRLENCGTVIKEIMDIPDNIPQGVIDHAYNRARTLLTTNIEKLHTMAKALLQYETIDSDQITAIMEGREPGPPKDWGKPSGTSAGCHSTSAGWVGCACPLRRERTGAEILTRSWSLRPAR